MTDGGNALDAEDPRSILLAAPMSPYQLMGLAVVCCLCLGPMRMVKWDYVTPSDLISLTSGLNGVSILGWSQTRLVTTGCLCHSAA